LYNNFLHFYFIILSIGRLPGSVKDFYKYIRYKILFMNKRDNIFLNFFFNLQSK